MFPITPPWLRSSPLTLLSVSLLDERRRHPLVNLRPLRVSRGFDPQRPLADLNRLANPPELEERRRLVAQDGDVGRLQGQGGVVGREGLDKLLLTAESVAEELELLGGGGGAEGGRRLHYVGLGFMVEERVVEEVGRLWLPGSEDRRTGSWFFCVLWWWVREQVRKRGYKRRERLESRKRLEIIIYATQLA